MNGCIGILFAIQNGEFIYIIVQSEDAACQQESLCDVHQRAVGNVVDVQHLVECQDNAAHNE